MKIGWNELDYTATKNKMIFFPKLSKKCLQSWTISAIIRELTTRTVKFMGRIGNTYNTFDLSELDGKHKDYGLTLEMTADLEDLRNTFCDDRFIALMRHNAGFDCESLDDCEKTIFNNAIDYTSKLRYISVSMLMSKLSVKQDVADKIMLEMQNQGIVDKSCVNGLHKVIVFRCEYEELTKAVDFTVRSGFVSVDSLTKQIDVDKDRAADIMLAMQELKIIDKPNKHGISGAIMSKEDWEKIKHE